MESQENSQRNFHIISDQFTRECHCLEKWRDSEEAVCELIGICPQTSECALK